MMADFNLAIGEILDHEGGYVCDQKDPGGETKFGISKRAYPTLNIKELTIDAAKAIYKRDYWDVLCLDVVQDNALALKIFDMGVNMGCGGATKIIQDALCRFATSVKIDGTMGEATIKALNDVRHPLALLNLIKALQVMKYLEIVKLKPDSKKFLAGWLNRV